MKVTSLEAIFLALQKAGTRYLVVGGIAVIAHGYKRTTEDLDLVLDLSLESVTKALNALESLGYYPRAPVKLHDFADPQLRKDWQEKRNMKVFQVISDNFPDAPIDLFVSEPFVFDVEYSVAQWYDVSAEISIPVVSLSALIAMKTEANRKQDHADIEGLRELHSNS